jgi:hypothetical protein
MTVPLSNPLASSGSAGSGNIRRHSVPALAPLYRSGIWLQEHLIIFLTPRVIYDTTEITDATEELKQKVRGLRKLMQNE